MLKASTGLRTKLLDTGSLKSILDGGVINIYSGPVPATADAALDPSRSAAARPACRSTTRQPTACWQNRR